MDPKPIPTNLLHRITLLILITGCDDRATQIAREAADRQAQQNTTMAELQKDVASGTRELVYADAQARKEIVGVHRDMAAERARLDSGWTNLESERRQIARQRRTESFVVPAIQAAGGLALVVVLLGFSWYVLVRLRASDPADAELSALLVEELLGGEEPDVSAHRPTIPNAADSRPRLR